MSTWCPLGQWACLPKLVGQLRRSCSSLLEVGAALAAANAERQAMRVKAAAQGAQLQRTRKHPPPAGGQLGMASGAK